MESIHLAVNGQAQLSLCSTEDLVPFAHSLHRRWSSGPFVTCDPRRRLMNESVRTAVNYLSGKEAVSAALNGSVCIRHYRQPKDYNSLVKEIRNKTNVTLIVIYISIIDHVKPAPVVIPSLREVGERLGPMIDEYVCDAIYEFDALDGCVDNDDKKWIAENIDCIADIEKFAMRLVALRRSGTLCNAAKRLGMASVSLDRWVRRHGMPSARLLSWGF